MKKHEYEIGDGRSFEVIHLGRDQWHTEGRLTFRGPGILFVEIFADGERVPYTVRGLDDQTKDRRAG